MVIGCMIAPIPQRFVGEWTVRVSDYDNRPIKGARVSQSWTNYTYNVSGEQNLYTDAEGKVVFAVQRRYGPVVYWLAKAAANVIGYGVHAGFGTMARVWVVEIGDLDPERKERLMHDQNAIDSLAATCGANCSAEAIQSHLRILSP
jgi:hypothetical protein